MLSSHSAAEESSLLSPPMAMGSLEEREREREACSVLRGRVDHVQEAMLCFSLFLELCVAE